MRIALLILAAYAALVAETTLLRELLPDLAAPLTVWALLPLLATTSPGALPVYAAGLIGLMVDAVGSGPLGLNVCVAVCVTCGLQRFLTSTSLQSLPRSLLAAVLCAVLLTMVMFVVQALAFGLRVEPNSFMRQLGFGVVLVSVWSSVVTLSLRLLAGRDPSPAAQHS